MNGLNALRQNSKLTGLSVFNIGEDGKLTYVETIKENISSPSDITFGKNGEVFVVNRAKVGETNGISVFTRDEATGKLTYSGFINDKVENGLVDVEVSADGSHLYVLDSQVNVLVFKRGDSGWSLVQNYQFPGANNGYAGGSLQLSPDGKSLYAGAY